MITHRHLDGTWMRLLRIDRGLVLEARDPNDGLGGDPEATSRYQYRWRDGQIEARRLPPARVGDRWRTNGGQDDPAVWRRQPVGGLIAEIMRDLRGALED